MRSRPYKIIFAMLILSVLAVLLLQGFWIKNFYNQKLEEFDKTIYAALEKINEKLQERHNIKVIRDQMMKRKQIPDKNKDITITKRTSHSSTSLNANGKKTVKQIVEIENNNGNAIQINGRDSMPAAFQAPQIFIATNKLEPGDSISTISLSHSTISIDNGSKKSIKTTVIKNKPKDQPGTKTEKLNDMDQLMDKMLMEIKIVGTDDTHPDTLKHIIQSALENKGIFIPFEFSLKKTSNTAKTEIVSQSSKFDSTKTSYRSDLSANKVFKTHNFLFLQFPQSGNVVFKQMKNILILSLVFAMMIIVVFYITLKTILKQKRLSDIKNDFINNMTHELKTPIATISLAVDALNNPLIKNNEQKFDQYTAILKEENQKLNAHVEHVLQVALLDKGELQLHKTTLNLNAVIRAAIHSHNLQVNEKKASVIFDPPTDIMMTADEFHLLNVFNNLLDNALKYSKDKCIVQISVNHTDTEVTVKIKDNGIGIEPELHKRIFEKFYRVQGGNLHDVKGFGLGLSYVKSIIEKHHGTIELYSELNKGSEFIIKLPVYES
jgi:two-component system phosphate regulon sensor histidine kinase PhoR